MYTILCSIYENCSLIDALQRKEIPEEKKPSSLIQVIEETEEDVGIHGL